MSGLVMLYEDDIVNSVCKYLASKGYIIKQQLKSTEKGDDVVAFCPVKKISMRIEAKGETSAVKTSKRYGKPFNESQVKDHVANAFFRAAKMLELGSGEDVLVGIALPNNQTHRDMVNAIKGSLKSLKIEVFLVDQNRSVTVFDHWK